MTIRCVRSPHNSSSLVACSLELPCWSLKCVRRKRGGGVMARGLDIEKLLQIFFYLPHHVQTCSLSANCSFACLPLDLAVALPFARFSPVSMMHTVTSLFLASVGFAFFVPGNSNALFARQSLDTTSSVYSTRFANVTWDDKLWRVTTTALDQEHYQSRQSIANGYIGSCWQHLELEGRRARTSQDADRLQALVLQL